HSYLSHMLRFPFSKIKIDRSRVQELDCVAEASAIVRALIVLGHSAGMRAGAKGVETPEQAELLRKEGCEEVQGYYFSRPMLAKDLENLVMGEKVMVA
ncbi:MAG: EAL domain-containing protein, partial [Nitrospirota bacterium]|nr:EAL domain-containing protein [Nitrospirota bacterium]